MRDIARALLLVCLSFNAVPALASPEAVVTPLVAKDLPELQGKERVMILVRVSPWGLGPDPSPRRARLRLCARGIHRDAASRCGRGHTVAWTDLLRGTQRHSHRGPECKQHAARQVCRVPRQEPGRADPRTSEVNRRRRGDGHEQTLSSRSAEPHLATKWTGHCKVCALNRAFVDEA